MSTSPIALQPMSSPPTPGLRAFKSNASLKARWRKSNYRRKPLSPDTSVDPVGNGDEEDGLLPSATLLGEAEQNGDFDEGWKAETSSTQTAKESFLRRWFIPQSGSKQSRTIPFGASDSIRNEHAANVVRNQKYNIVSFLPLVLYEQFKFFFNTYFLLVALSQIIPALRIGYLATYIVPLAFVLLVTIGKEAYDDWQRFTRDKAANSTRYQILDANAAPSSRPTPNSHHLSTPLDDPEAAMFMSPLKSIPSSRLRVGDLVLIEKNQRVPADIVLLRTSDSSGTCFIRTDQLDGETDWKLKVALESTQNLPTDASLLQVEGEVYADPPSKDIHSFVGTLTVHTSHSTTDLDTPTAAIRDEAHTYAITADHLLWSNTVLAAGQAIGFVVYTGRDTRAVMNTSHPETKVGLLDLEINRIAKILCAVTFALSILLVALNGFRGQWYIYIFRFLILFSTIIPISLRVNLDMGKTVYGHQIEHDSEIAGTIVRTSTLPEELGRIEYLLSDKTGTLTQNEMDMKKLHMGTMSYAYDSMDEVAHQLAVAFGNASGTPQKPTFRQASSFVSRGRRDMSSRVKDVVSALALCHNVTPVLNEDNTVTYQASSPDEVAIVQWTEAIGLTLHSRTRTRMELKLPNRNILAYEVLEIFPFTSETKRMGIVIREEETQEISFFEKGADVVMARIVQQNDWLEEECGNMAREGLRTLVVGRKRLTEDAWLAFERAYRDAKVSLKDRNEAMVSVISQHLEHNLELLGVTGVEDKLQENVKMTLELLRNAGIKIWMLTGDKIETATCIAISSKLVARGQYIHQVAKRASGALSLITAHYEIVRSLAAARDELDFLLSKLDCCLVVDGESLQLFTTHFRQEFIEIATELPAVVACRCSPTQKADIARLIREYTKKRVCCIGDGGNDVSMIQAADVGVGIVGKEGKQASLAADFSILQFSYLSKLLCWHGRNSYKRSAKLAQFVVHRGLLVAVIQAVFSCIVYFSPVAIFQDWLSVGYATVYTMGPVFSLVLDTDINEDLALLYPELYAELTKGRSLSFKTFFVWVAISVYQGGAIMIASMLLFENEFVNIVAIAFTATILNELVMVAVEVTTWHPLMVTAEIVTLLLYAASMAFLPQYFDLNFVLSTRFIWKVGIIVCVSAFPLVLIKYIRRKLAPASYSKIAAGF